MAFSGILSSFKVSSNSLINGAVGNLLDNVAGGVVNVALGDRLGQQVTSALGLPALGNSNFLGSIVTPGLLSSGNQALNQVLTRSLGNSGALGPAGNLVTNAFGQLSGGVLSGLNPTVSIPPNKFFAGAGGEEDADYGGNLYTPGPVGPDIVFSIKPAQSSASVEANSQIYGFTGGIVGTSIPWGQVPDLDLPPNFLSNTTQSSFLGDFSSGLTAGTNRLAEISGTNAAVPGAWLGSLRGSSSTISAAIPGGAESSGSSTSATLTAQGNILLSPNASDSKSVPLLYDSLFPPTPGSQAFFSASSLALEPFTNTDLAAKIGFGSPFSSVGGSNSSSPTSAGGWTFTTAPRDVSWDTTAKVDRVPIFGTNQPPVISGSRGMRDLTLSNALIEGFSMFKSIENKIIQLEALLNYTLTTSYVKVPVYWVTASDKKYGAGNGDGGYFVIKNIKVKEEMRDLKGRGTRAVVDIAFTQVPPYQVDDGRDLASKSVAGARSILGNVGELFDKTIKEGQKNGTLSLFDPGAASAGGSTQGGSQKPKPGQVEIAPGVFKPRFKDVKNPNGTVDVLEFDVQSRKYVTKAEFDRLQATRQRAANSASSGPTLVPQQP